MEYLEKGIPNLLVHIENLRKFTSSLVVVLNEFDTDTQEEIDYVKAVCESLKVEFAISEAYLKGGVGAISLADKVIKLCDQENDFKLLYDETLPIVNKIETICKEIYHAGSVKYTEEAINDLNSIKDMDESALPICVAKTQYSISDDPKKLGYPKDYEVVVRNIELHTGSGFIVVYLGSILTMPGLPKVPNYEKIDLDEDNNIIGIF
jgi:formate--tetrahydrofolate ligase